MSPGGVTGSHVWLLPEPHNQDGLSHMPTCAQGWSRWVVFTCMSTDAMPKNVGFNGCVGDLQTRDTSEDLVDKVLDMARKDFWLLQRLYALSDGSQEARQRTPLVGLFQAALSNAQLSGDDQSGFPAFPTETSPWMNRHERLTCVFDDWRCECMCTHHSSACHVVH